MPRNTQTIDFFPKIRSDPRLLERVERVARAGPAEPPRDPLRGSAEQQRITHGARSKAPLSALHTWANLRGHFEERELDEQEICAAEDETDSV